MPPLGWCHYSPPAEPFSRSRVEPIKAAVDSVVLKPLSGGLWCCPLRSSTLIPGAVWTDWALDYNNEFVPLQLIRARNSARVLVVENIRHLRAMLERWPADLEINARLPEFLQRRQLDWPALAQDVDAVWLTAKGNSNLRHTHFEGNMKASIYGWDTETVFFLNPAFTVGRRRTVPVHRIRKAHNELREKFDTLVLRLIAQQQADKIDKAAVRSLVRALKNFRG